MEKEESGRKIRKADGGRGGRPERNACFNLSARESTSQSGGSYAMWCVQCATESSSAAARPVPRCAVWSGPAAGLLQAPKVCTYSIRHVTQRRFSQGPFSQSMRKCPWSQPRCSVFRCNGDNLITLRGSIDTDEADSLCHPFRLKCGWESQTARPGGGPALLDRDVPRLLSAAVGSGYFSALTPADGPSWRAAFQGRGEDGPCAKHVRMGGSAPNVNLT